MSRAARCDVDRVIVSGPPGSKAAISFNKDGSKSVDFTLDDTQSATPEETVEANTIPETAWPMFWTGTEYKKLDAHLLPMTHPEYINASGEKLTDEERAKIRAINETITARIAAYTDPIDAFLEHGTYRENSWLSKFSIGRTNYDLTYGKGEYDNADSVY